MKELAPLRLKFIFCFGGGERFVGGGFLHFARAAFLT